MYQIYSGSTGVLTVQIRSLNEAGRYSWMTEEEAIDEYQKQKKLFIKVKTLNLKSEISKLKCVSVK